MLQANQQKKKDRCKNELRMILQSLYIPQDTMDGMCDHKQQKDDYNSYTKVYILDKDSNQ
jgi:hypothetical protein